VWTENTPLGGKYLPDLVRLQVVTFTEIITGKRALDAFDDFVREWHAQGGDNVTREANALHARKRDILAAVRAHLPPDTP
jgi:putative aldouronate transport system substrate-binding protein